MPRQTRNIAQGNTHHCFTRCHGKRDLMKSSHVRKYLIEAVKKCQEKYDFELIAAEPLTNHIHLVIRTLEDKETVSRIMQYVKARIAEMYNRSTGTTGPFWNERFGSTVIEEADDPEQYLLWLLWYIGYNPVRKKLVRDPRQADVGFINVYLIENFEAPVKITRHAFFNRLGDTFSACVEKFLKYEEAYRKRMIPIF
ncbi:MAG: hypothetical protein CVV44_13965 [Spirochaetae bacterium HGW-Spirochaetae-1]|jgi:REP element-mobilizing transposase RayT|nr:MAG: hypothetical protein CVV44_13965 [Spirochaetae bacterium HGW-Spirochaetae-1]